MYLHIYGLLIGIGDLQ